MSETDDRDCIHVQMPRGRQRQTNNAGESEPMKFLINSTEDWLRSKVGVAIAPVLWIDVGLPPGSSLVNGYRLNSYALAFSDRIKALTGMQLNGLKLTKCQNPFTTLRLTEEVEISPSEGADSVTLKTRKSYAKPDFEAEVRDATEHFSNTLSQTGQLHLSISYTTGLPRTWSRLLEPTVRGILTRPNRIIDAARITGLSLDHRSLGESFEHWVELTVSNRCIPAGINCQHSKDDRG